MLSIYNFKDYVKYLHSYKSQSKNNGRGFKLAVAKKLNCQSTYISQIFKDTKNITLEHADQLNQFLGHSPEESIYFLLLVQYKRAGSQSLSKHFLHQIEQQRIQHLKLNKHLQMGTKLEGDDRRTYYSSWVYAATHIFLTTSIEGVSADTITSGLNINHQITEKVLQFLTKTGLAQKKINKFFPGQSQMHLEDEAPEIKMHHTNWRLKAISSVALQHQDNLHYSSVVSLSKDDLFKIKNTLIEVLKDIKLSIKKSPPETLACFNIDFFNMEH